MATILELLAYFIILLVLLLLLSFTILTLYLAYVHWVYRHFPGPKRDSFFLGNLPMIIRERKRGKTIHHIIVELHEVFGSIVLLWSLHIPFTFVSDPEMVRKCLVTLNLPKNPRVYWKLAFPFGQRAAGRGLLTENDHKVWQERRALLNPAFHRRYLMNLMSAFNRSSDLFLAKIGELADGKTSVDMAEEFTRVTLDVIGKVAFNVDLDTVRNANSPFPLAVLKSLQGIQQCLQNPLWRISVSTFPFQRSAIEAVKFIRSFGKKVIQDRQEAMQKGEDTPSDILAHILHVGDKHPSIGIDDMVDDFLTFFIAGQETTSNQLAFTLHEILRHPDVENRVLQEIDQVLGARHFVEYTDLGKLQYLGQTLKEGLRLHPPVGGFTRVTVKEENIGGYVFPAGTSVNFSMFIMHRSSQAWREPERFDPDRFSPASSSEISRSVYFPFSLGSRTCIGQTFAQFEARVLMARLLQEFELELLPGQQEIQHDEKLTLRPRGGVWCVVNKRKKNKSIHGMDKGDNSKKIT